MKKWLLDTNVVSELRKGPRCSLSVMHWYANVPPESLHLSVLVLGELRFGIEKIRVRDVATAQSLERWLQKMEGFYQGRIVPVTAEICDLWGRLSLQERLPSIDALQAATALHHGFTFVTRNKKDIERSGVDFFDPFIS